MTTLPIVPAMLREEAPSSWIARIASRYDLSPYSLARHLLPAEDGYAEMVRWIDSRAADPLEQALARAARDVGVDFTVRRLAGLTADPSSSWLRQMPAWCPRCLASDLAKTGEVHLRREWSFGGYVICPKHHRLLSRACPKCLRPAVLRAVRGRLRLWCPPCGRCADTMPEASAIGTWPSRQQPSARACRTVSLSAIARASLLHVQAGLLALQAGRRLEGDWTHGLDRQDLLDLLRRFAFVMLGPLAEERWRSAQGRIRGRAVRLSVAPEAIDVSPSDDWTPGALPPEVAATAILVCAAILAAEAGVRLAGVTWDRRVLADGESETIEAATLLRHLTSAERQSLCRLFVQRRGKRPFSALLYALADDDRCSAAEHEERRRKRMRAERLAESKTLTGSSDWAGTAARQRRESASPWPSLDNAPGRFQPAASGSATVSSASRTRDDVTAAVELAFAMDPASDAADLSRYAGSLFGNRYIHYWLRRHLHLPPNNLIEILARAVEMSRARDRGIVLPETPQDQMFRPVGSVAHQPRAVAP